MTEVEDVVDVDVEVADIEDLLVHVDQLEVLDEVGVWDHRLLDLRRTAVARRD